MERFEEARSSRLLAGEAVQALFQGEESDDALVGAMILAAGALAWVGPEKG